MVTDEKLSFLKILFKYIIYYSWAAFKIFPMEFPRGLVVRIPNFQCGDLGSITGWGTDIPRATSHS